MYLHHDTLSHITPHTEIIMTDFITHVLALPLLEVSPIPSNNANNVPKSVQRLGSVISKSPSDIWIATVTFSPLSHWAGLIIDCQAWTISWGDSVG